MELTIGDKTVEAVRITEFEWPEPGPVMFFITCLNHPTAKYSSKNPYLRNLHFLQPAQGYRDECPCSFNDLVVIPNAKELGLDA